MIKPITSLDLHMHTTASDGTDTPAEILEKARKAGLGLFAVTDHDAISSCAAISALRADSDPLFINGIEFSCRDQEGKYHILGYHYDQNGEAITALLKKSSENRLKKLANRLDCLKDRWGFVFSQESIDALHSLSSPGKPHIALMMVEYGYVKTKEIAISDYLNRIHFKNFFYIRPEEAIESIIKSGGIPILAHPAYGSGDELILGQELEDRVLKLMDFGLRGIEVFYSGFTPKLISQQLALAEKYQLFTTAGSDYHGKNKPQAIGDTNLPPADEWPKGLLNFIDAVT